MKSIAQWEVVQHWDRIAELLMPVLARPEADNTLEDVRQFLISGGMQAWHVDWRVIVVTAIQTFGSNPQAPTKRVCQVVFCSGTGMDDWLEPVVTHLKAWAQSMNCHCLRISGRIGWKRVLPDFHETCTTLECEICPR